MIATGFGFLSPHDPNYGLPLKCYLCGVVHKALGLATIKVDQAAIHYLPLCERCCGDPTSDNAIMRKFLKAPNLEIKEGGMATTEQLEAIVDKLTDGATEH